MLYSTWGPTEKGVTLVAVSESPSKDGMAYLSFSLDGAMDYVSFSLSNEAMASVSFNPSERAMAFESFSVSDESVAPLILDPVK